MCPDDLQRQGMQKVPHCNNVYHPNPSHIISVPVKYSIFAKPWCHSVLVQIKYCLAPVSDHPWRGADLASLPASYYQPQF